MHSSYLILFCLLNKQLKITPFVYAVILNWKRYRTFVNFYFIASKSLFFYVRCICLWFSPLLVQMYDYIYSEVYMLIYSIQYGQNYLEEEKYKSRKGRAYFKLNYRPLTVIKFSLSLVNYVVIRYCTGCCCFSVNILFQGICPYQKSFTWMWVAGRRASFRFLVFE